MDIQIGEPSKSCSALTIGHFESDIYINTDTSENRYEYWCTSKILDVSIRINKETKEGIKLTKLIESGSAKRVNNFLDTIAIKHLTVRDFKHKISQVKRDSFTEGKQMAQRNMRSALGM